MERMISSHSFARVSNTTKATFTGGLRICRVHAQGTSKRLTINARRIIYECAESVKRTVLCALLKKIPFLLAFGSLSWYVFAH
jgi:hypothetical protein